MFSFIIFGKFGNFASLFFPFLIIKIFQITSNKQERIQSRLNQFFLVALFIILIFYFIHGGYKDSISVKELTNGKQLEFKEQGILYNTKSDSLNFVGETNEYLFLYNTRNKETLIFNKSAITNLKIKDTSLTKEEIQKKIDNFLKNKIQK
jgi:hypothetical protein